MKCTNDYHHFEPFKTGSNKLQCQCREFFIAPTFHGSEIWHDAWRLGQPKTQQILGAPFRTVADAIAACNNQPGPEAA